LFTEDSISEAVHAMAAKGDEESSTSDNDVDPEQGVFKEDKERMHCLAAMDSEVLNFEKWYDLPTPNYRKKNDTMKLPKVKKHVTPEQLMDVLHFIGKKLDPMNTKMPTVEETRSFVYLQELFLLFVKKEKLHKKE
jgi:hypothetical protein